MPIASANALAWLTPPPASQSASTTPTAMPSGMLCIVMASISFVERESPVAGPSSCRSMWVWGVKVSSRSRNPMPARKPMAAGPNASAPRSDASSSDGCSKPQNDAATMTPAANPTSTFVSFDGMSRRKKNTTAAPSVVPRKGSIRPCATVM